QLTLYAYAIKFGELLVDGIWVKPNMLVDSVGIYFLRAHEIYKRKTGNSNVGDEKGDPFFRTAKSINGLRAFRTEIRHQLSAMVKPWYYPNTASGACSYCSYTAHCISRNDNLPTDQAEEAQELVAELNMA
ncbi:MAG: hypothetical protein HOB84_11730, partial [Candidatus Marinimicrobia bacterium]|nr:hypothetical protein [Candidatus Neomarinimicrobiota bacterium]